ncbi:MAG: YIP1 family protein [Pseudomonadota bacterium]
MAVTLDILATYRRPGRVISRILDRGADHRHAFAFLAVGSVLAFVAQLPRLTRLARESDPEFEAAIVAEAGEVRQIDSVQVPEAMVDAKFEALMSGALMGWIFIMPLILYALAWLSLLLVRLIKGRMTGAQACVVLFWAFLAAIPVFLFQGLIAGFVGPGAALNTVSLVWFALFVWFWFSGIRVAAWEKAA